jgi:hypothetical protein
MQVSRFLSKLHWIFKITSHDNEFDILKQLVAI